MVGFKQIMFYLQGALILSRFNPTGKIFFPKGREACIQSFQVAIILLPVYFYQTFLSRKEDNISDIYFYLVQFIGYILIWTAFPLILYYVIRFLGREENFFNGLTLLNWSILVQNLYVIPFSLLFAFGILPPDLIILFFALLLYVQIYQGYVLKVGFEINALAAAMLVLADFTLRLYLDNLISRILLG